MKITREAKIGFFAVICLTVLVLGVEFLKGKNIFSRTNTYYAVFRRVDGLKPTNPIMLSGYKVGTVKSIRFEEGHTGRLIVSLLIEKRYKIPLNSTAKLISADIMGGKAIRLEFSSKEEFHQAGDTLVSSIETGLLDQMIFEMVPIKDKAENLMEDMEKVMEAIVKLLDEENRANLKSSFENLNRITASMDEIIGVEDGKLQQILSNAHTLSVNLKENSKKFDEVMKNFAAISDTLAKANFISTLAQADSAMTSFNHIASKINNGQGTIGMLLHNDTLYNNLEQATKNLELLLFDMKVNPKRYVNISLFDFSRTRYVESKD